MEKRAPWTHIIIVDGTQSRLDEGYETNAGLLFKLLKESQPVKTTKLWYDQGIQGHGLWNWVTIASGLGLNSVIQDAYAQLCSKYMPGDKIHLFGFSRGAYAVRSLAGLIKQIGVVRQKDAIARNISKAFFLYETDNNEVEAKAFCDAYCEEHVEIEMIGVWDTVKALGLPYPLLSRLAPMATEFHNDRIGPPVKNGYQALALHETRQAYSPVVWHRDPGWTGHLEQVWFRGAHSDIGGHVGPFQFARPLSNIPLVWMLEKCEDCGLVLPDGWRDRFPCDPDVEPIGDRRKIAKFFLWREQREFGLTKTEFVHPTALKYLPKHMDESHIQLVNTPVPGQ